MLQTILSAVLGLFFTVLFLGFLWVWFLGPIAKSLYACCKKFVETLSSTFKVGISIGNKLIKPEVKKVVEPEGEVTPGTVLMDAIVTPSYEIAKWVKSQPIPKVGYVLLRGYSQHLERCLVINTTSLQKKFGRRLQLENLQGEYHVDDLVMVNAQTLELVNSMVEASISKIESKPVKTPKVVAIEKPEVAQSIEPVAHPEKTSIPEVKKDKPLEKYTGYLIGYGKAVRHISSKKNDDNADDAGKEIEQFRIVIRSEDGVEESIWGQDLLRAIKDANITINDMIEVIKTGKRQFGSSFKNLYAITKVA